MKRIDSSDLKDLNLTELELDARLADDGQDQIRQLVRSMDEEPASLAWRSRLNENLLAIVESKRRKRRFAWILSPTLGLGLAGALAFVLMSKAPPAMDTQNIAGGSQLEESLVATHRDALRYSDISGVGLSPEEVVSRRTPSSYELIEVGFDAQ
jgi:hypothetical protein